MESTLTRCVLALAVVVALAVPASSQDVVVLNDGQRFTGAIQWETGTSIMLEVDFGLIQFSRRKVREVRRSVSPPRPGPRRAGRRPAPGRSPAPSGREPAEARTPAESDRPLAPSGRPAGDPGLAREIRHLLGTLEALVGPHLPRRQAAKILVGILVFLGSIGLTQLGCWFVELETFTLRRGASFAGAMVLVFYGTFLMKDHLEGPYEWGLALALGFSALVLFAAAVFNHRMLRSAMLVGFVLVGGAVCLSCLAIGIWGVMQLKLS